MTGTSENIAGLRADCRVTSLLIQGLSDNLLREVDKYRLLFEKKWGPVDLTRRYTSTLPEDDQNWLLTYEPERFWAGLPKFYQAFVRGKMEAAANIGMLDEMHAGFIRLYANKKMNIKGERGV